MLLNLYNSQAVSITQIPILSEPMLLMILGIVLLIAVQGARQWMKKKVKF